MSLFWGPLAALVVAVSLIELTVIWQFPSRVPTPCPVASVLVMGAAQYDGRPSPALQRRLDRALALYREGCTERIVVSGGARPGDRFTEGEAGVLYLAEQGVPERFLASETAASSSFENLLLTRPLLGEGPIVIVTDDLHAYRTQWLASHLGIPARLAPVRVSGGRAGYAFREWLIMLGYHLGIVR